jgi:hypothetical protein
MRPFVCFVYFVVQYPMRAFRKCLYVGILLLLADMQNLAADESARRGTDNGFIQLSSRALNLAFERDVEDRRMVQESILGATASGLVSTRGRVTAHLVPGHGQGMFEVRLAGIASVGNGAAQRRAVTILTSVNTSIDARKRVLVGETGLHPLAANASCESVVCVNEIVARRRLVEAFAGRRIARRHPELEHATARRAEVRASQDLDLQCNALLGEVQSVFRDKIREPLLRNQLWPAQMTFHTTANHLQMYALQANDFQSGAPERAPAVNPRHDIAVGFHESLVRNVCESTLRGTAIKDRHWLELMKALTGQAPRSLWVHDRSVPWEVTFADERPAAVEFKDDGFQLTLRFDRIRRGEQYLARPVVLTTGHRLERSPEGAVLIRRGDLRVEFADGRAADADEMELVAFVKRKLEAVFQPELYFDGLVPPVGRTWDKIRQLELKEFAAENGWLTFGYQLPATQH